MGKYMTRKFHLPMKQFLSLRPQLDDIEAEITYLLVREGRPENIVEISPSSGWSSSWMLQALKDNGSGMLHSFDIINDSEYLLPLDLTQGRWEFIVGDARRTIRHGPPTIDFLFMDSDHSETFAEWYTGAVLTRLNPGTMVAVHDVFHTSDPCGHNKEGGVIVRWLEERHKGFVTASPAREPGYFEAIMKLRHDLSFGNLIHSSQTNSMIFFLT